MHGCARGAALTGDQHDEGGVGALGEARHHHGDAREQDGVPSLVLHGAPVVSLCTRQCGREI